MKRIVYVVLMLMLSMPMWADNSVGKKNWLVVNDPVAYSDKLNETIDVLDKTGAAALLDFLNLKKESCEYIDRLDLFDRYGQKIPTVATEIYERVLALAQKYMSMKTESAQAARAAGALLALTEIEASDVGWGYAARAFVEIADGALGIENPEGAELLKNAAEQIRVDFESFK